MKKLNISIVFFIIFYISVKIDRLKKSSFFRYYGKDSGISFLSLEGTVKKSSGKIIYNTNFLYVFF